MTMDRLLLEDRLLILNAGDNTTASPISTAPTVPPDRVFDYPPLDSGLGRSGYPQNVPHPVHLLFFFTMAAMILFVMVKKYQDRKARLERERLENDPEEQARRQRELILREQELRLQQQQELEIQEKAWLLLIEEKQLSKVLDLKDFKTDASLAAEDPKSLGNDTGTDIETGDTDETPATRRSDDDNHAGNITRSGSSDMMERDPTNKNSEEGAELATKSSALPSGAESTIDTKNCAQIVIPRNGAADGTSGDDEHRAANNLCAVCLDPYSDGDRIVWSNNIECQHVFHHACMLDYYTTMVKKRQQQRRDGSSDNNDEKNKDQQTICPCCRQEFFVD